MTRLKQISASYESAQYIGSSEVRSVPVAESGAELHESTGDRRALSSILLFQLARQKPVRPVARPHPTSVLEDLPCLWAGVDLRTLQQWLGHSDMESTMRYLKPSRSQQARAKVNKIFAL